MAGQRSPVFEMHGQYPGWSQVLPAGSSGTLRVVWDPGVHDHAGEDRVVQGVSIVSNDPREPEALVKIAARVRR